MNLDQRIEELKACHDYFEITGDNGNELIVFLDNIRVDGAEPNPFADNRDDYYGWVEVEADFVAAFREVENEEEDLVWSEVKEVSDSEWDTVEEQIISQLGSL